MLIPLILVTAVVLYVLHTLTKKLEYWDVRKVKYVKPLPLFGNMFPFVVKSLGIPELIEKFYNEFPSERYVGIFQFTKPVLILKDPELIKKVTIKNFEHFVDHTSFFPEDIDPLWAKNLFSSKGERWRDLRQTLSPVFTSSKMRTMFGLMEENAKQIAQFFKQQGNNIIEVELKDVFTRFTNDVIASTAFGIKCDSLKHRTNEFLMNGRELSDTSGLKRFIILFFNNFPWLARVLGVKFVSDKVGNFFRTIIDDTLKLREEKNIVRPDLIHLMMLARQGKLKYEEITNESEEGFAVAKESETNKVNKTEFLSNEDITAQAVVFFLGGFDTSSALMCFLGHELAVNPEVQSRLKEEIIQTFQKAKGKVTYEHILGIKYLDMVISEALRKWPPAIFLDRVCTKDIEVEPERDGEVSLKLKAGDTCWIPVYGLHRDPKYFPNPDIFDPERFSDENKDNIKPEIYLPFGTGPRNCIGSRFALLETKILYFYLLLDFDIVPISKTQIPLKISKNTALFTAEKGFHVGLKRTKENSS